MSTTVDVAVKAVTLGASMATLIVPDVYPVPPSNIFVSSILPPFARTTSPAAAPVLNATVGVCV